MIYLLNEFYSIFHSTFHRRHYLMIPFIYTKTPTKNFSQTQLNNETYTTIKLSHNVSERR